MWSEMISTTICKNLKDFYGSSVLCRLENPKENPSQRSIIPIKSKEELGVNGYRNIYFKVCKTLPLQFLLGLY